MISLVILKHQYRDHGESTSRNKAFAPYSARWLSEQRFRSGLRWYSLTLNRVSSQATQCQQPIHLPTRAADPYQFPLTPRTVSLLLGWHAVFSDPSEFVSRQLPATLNAAPIPASAALVSISYGNVFLLLAGMAVLCTVVTRDANITKWYLIIVACGDIGHIYANYAVMGPQVFWDFSQYNEIMWGNVAVTLFLHVNRLATLLGLFGRIRSSGAAWLCIC